MKILYSGFRDPSHSTYGGYDKITGIDLPKKVLLSEYYPLGRCNFKSHLMRIPFTFLDIHTRLLRHKYNITHLFYGEITMLFFLPYFKRKKHKTIITIHLDIEKRRCPKLFIWLLKFFDGIIVLSSRQQKYLETKYNIRSTFIPHGFSQPQFEECLPYDKRGYKLNESKINILTVGNNYRDFDTLKYVINRFKDNSNYQFHLVGVPREINIYFSEYKNVSLYSRLSNNEFYSLISVCDYGFLPLTFATANNTLLEYQYLDLPSILPNIHGVMDYAAPAPLNLFYSNRAELCEMISSLTKTVKNNLISDFAKTHFNWDIIYDAIEDYYRNIIKE